MPQENHAVEFRKKKSDILQLRLAFTCVDYKVDSRTTDGYVPFQIQGQPYHLHGLLKPNRGQASVYAQVWFYDLEMANQS